MQSNAEILEQAAGHVRKFQEHARTTWLDQMKEAFALRENIQWLSEDYDRVVADGLTPYTINLTAPILNAVIGFQVQNRSEVTYTPRLLGDDRDRAKKFADVAENGVNWIEGVSQAEFHDSAAFADTVTCGIGATDASVDYDHNEFGLPAKNRVFPGFLMWDPAACQKNLMDRNWCGWAQIVHKDDIDEEGDEESDAAEGVTFDDTYFLDWFNTLAETDLAVVYQYYWRRKEHVYLIENPFIRHTGDPLLMNWLADAASRLRFDPAASYLSLGKAEYPDFKKEIAALAEIDVVVELPKPIRKSKWRYYRAKIAGGKVISKALNYSQTGFSLKFMTGNYSEVDRCFYGMVRDLRDPQRLLNQAVSDIAGYYRSIPKGGVNIEAGAVDSLEDFIATYGKARDVTVFKKDALKEGRVIPKTPAQMPPGLLETATAYADLMVRVAGLTPQFMGLMETRNMTGVLHGQLVQQGLTVLSPYFDGMKFYQQENGLLYIDLLRVLAQNCPERPVRNITGLAKSDYLPLLEDDLAAEYDVEIEDTPLTPTQRQETFEKLIAVGTGFMQTNPQLASATIGEALEYSPLQADQIDRIKQAATPIPQPPNPMEQMLVQAETKAKIAEAGQKEADAYKKTIEAAAIIKNELHGTAPTAEQPAAPVVDPMAVLESTAKFRREKERDEMEAARAAKEDAHKEKEFEHKATTERGKAELDAMRLAEEDERKAAEERRKDRELKLKEREMELREKELDARGKDSEESRGFEREKLRYANPSAAEALDMLETKKDAAAKEADARIDELRREGEASRKTSEKSVGQLTAVLEKVVTEQTKLAKEQTKSISGALAGVGKAIDKLADAQQTKQLAAALDGMGRAVVCVAEAQSEASNRTDDGLKALAKGMAALAKPRKKTVEIVRGDGSTVTATMEG